MNTFWSEYADYFIIAGFNRTVVTAPDSREV